MEEILMPYVQDADVDSVYTVVGRWDPNLVYITVPLAHWDDREKSQQEIIDEMRPKLANIPGAPGRAFGSNSLNLRGQGGGLELALTGDTYDRIYASALDFSKIIEDRLPELGRPNIGYQPTQPQLRVNIDRRRAEELGVPFSDISTSLRAAISGDDITDLNIGDQAVPLILQSTNREMTNPSELTN